MALLNVAVTVVLVATPIAPDTGTVEITVGGVLFTRMPVVKLHI